MICVSISSFEEVVKKIGPAISDGQAVMDICSIKEFPVKVMHDNIKHGLILGTHPLFGPGSKDVKHKTYILTPTNEAEDKYADGFKKWLEKEEAHVFVMPPKKHDELMSVVLGIAAFSGLSRLRNAAGTEKLSRNETGRRNNLPHAVHFGRSDGS